MKITIFLSQYQTLPVKLMPFYFHETIENSFVFYIHLHGNGTEAVKSSGGLGNYNIIWLCVIHMPSDELCRTTNINLVFHVLDTCFEHRHIRTKSQY